MVDCVLIPFNEWSRERIIMGRKSCTSRHKMYTKDPLVKYITFKVSWGYIKSTYYKEEGADSPQELQRVIEDIYHRKVSDDELFYVHFFDNVEMTKRLLNGGKDGA